MPAKVYTTALFSDTHDDNRSHKGSDEDCEESEDVSRAVLRAGDMGIGSADMLGAATGREIMEYYRDVRSDMRNTRVVHKRSGRVRSGAPEFALTKSKAVIQFSKAMIQTFLRNLERFARHLESRTDRCRAQIGLSSTYH